jgi:NAD+ synthase
MAATFRLTLAQANPVVGDLAGNAAQARAAWEAGRAAGSALVALPEMFLTGYQTQDLILKPAFLDAVEATLADLAAACADGPALGIGAPLRRGGRLHNAWHVLEGGRVSAVVLKHHLPNDSVFDEKRLFSAAEVTGPYRIGPLRIGTPICEDAWYPDVAETLAETGAEILLVPNGSPYHRGKHDQRLSLMVARVVETGLPLVYLNMVGGQDDQVFDGASFVLNPGGRLAVQMPAFARRWCMWISPRPRMAGGPKAGRWRPCPTRPRPITAPWSRGCATTWASRASGGCCWACRAGSIRRWWRRSRRMRWGRRRCGA